MHWRVCATESGSSITLFKIVVMSGSWRKVLSGMRRDEWALSITTIFKNGSSTTPAQLRVADLGVHHARCNLAVRSPICRHHFNPLQNVLLGLRGIGLVLWSWLPQDWVHARMLSARATEDLHSLVDCLSNVRHFCQHPACLPKCHDRPPTQHRPERSPASALCAHPPPHRLCWLLKQIFAVCL